MRRIIALVFLAVAIQGCATSSISKDYTFDEKSENGLVVGSITFDGFFASYNIYIRNIETGEEHRIQCGGDPLLNLFNTQGNLGHLGIKGDLYAVELPPGKYEFYKWMVDNNNGTHLYPNNKFTINLQVNSGAALYVGSVHFKQTQTFGSTISGVETFYTNKNKRDLEEFSKKYVNVNLPQVKIPMKENEYLALGNDSRSSNDILFQAISRSLSMPNTYK